MQDFVTTFISLAIAGDKLDLQEKGLQIAHMDNQSDGPYMPFWERISYPNPVIKMNDSNRPKPFQSERTCLKSSIYNVHGGVSLLTYTGINRCHSPIIQAFGQWTLDLFGVSRQSSTNMSSSSSNLISSDSKNSILKNTKKVIRIVWSSRPPPDPASPSFAKLTSWQRNRIVYNEKDVIDYTQQQIRQLYELDSSTTPPMFEGFDLSNIDIQLESIPFGSLTFENQLKSMANINILIGMHGAGLVHSLWMTPNSPQHRVIELLPRGFGGAFHLKNMAYWMGIKYIPVNVRLIVNTLPVETVWDALKVELKSILTSMSQDDR